MSENPLNYGGAWNFGPDSSQINSVQRIVSLLLEKLPKLKVNYIDSYLKESKFLMINSYKALENLGWESVMSLNETLELVVEWETEVNKDVIKTISIDQILKYGQKIKGKYR